MIRGLFLTALVAIFCIVFYIPSKVAPEEFGEVWFDEHDAVSELWGEDVAERVDARARRLKTKSAAVLLDASPSSLTRAGLPANAVDSAIVRLFGATYFRSLDSVFVLASYRLSCAIELLPALLAFLIAAAIDGSVVRVVRSKELIAHSAERFSVSLAIGFLLGLGVVVAWFLPVVLHPMWVLAALLGMLFAMSRALANYHLFR